MGRRARTGRRTRGQVLAEQQARELARRLGTSIRSGRLALGERQVDSAERAGVSQQTWSSVERGADPRVTLDTVCRCAMAVDSALRAYLERISSADRPRDAVHLRHQELVLSLARRGGWTGVPEAALDRDARTSRSLDVLLTRRSEWAIVEIWDWFDDVGQAFRDWDRRLDALERLAIARTPPPSVAIARTRAASAPADPPRSSGVWLVRSTRRNRELVSDHGNLFRARFPGSGQAWLRALTDPLADLPARPACRPTSPA